MKIYIYIYNGNQFSTDIVCNQQNSSKLLFCLFVFLFVGVKYCVVACCAFLLLLLLLLFWILLFFNVCFVLLFLFVFVLFCCFLCCVLLFFG